MENLSAKTDDLILEMPEAGEGETGLIETGGLLLVAWVIGLISVWVGVGTSPLVALPGMIVFFLCSVAGLLLARFVPVSIPAVGWVSLIAILITVPGVPGADWVVEVCKKVDFLSLATPALAYGGLALTGTEFAIARRSGWKIVVVAICVMLGTYVGSVIIANLTIGLG
ncbi:hypothetical protein [Acidimangrovimonas sediminis]|uniref:hypothetical protein n=1 Tax=Acidimangrovimonas sediminis TaxID=2056283 RepID=UPI000C8072A7|nr:hypothetical protein [Acidimangrovimonas sediminis]